MIGAILAVSSLARADEPPPIPVTKVELAERPEIAKTGKIALYKGEADDKGVAFYIDGLGINTPVTIVLTSGEAASPMRLSVKNDLSPDWDRHVKADNGISTARFRTEGPAMALVQSPSADRKPYHVAIWVGPELKLHQLIAPPFVSQAEYDKGHPGGGGGGGGSSTGVIVGVIGTVVILIVVGALVLRRKKGARS